MDDTVNILSSLVYFNMDRQLAMGVSAAVNFLVLKIDGHKVFLLYLAEAETPAFHIHESLSIWRPGAHVPQIEVIVAFCPQNPTREG
jgi:hypothetical protein